MSGRSDCSLKTSARSAKTERLANGWEGDLWKEEKEKHAGVLGGGQNEQPGEYYGEGGGMGGTVEGHWSRQWKEARPGAAWEQG